MNSNLVNLIPQFFDSSGNPLSGGTLETYVAGTSTTLATYPTNSDAIAGTNANSTSISIGSSGYPMSGSNIIGVFLRPGKQYKFILKDSSGTTIYTVDNISNLTDAIYDGNGNEVLKLVGVSNSVNEITITNATTGNAPSITATGDDTNVGLTVRSKGTGTLALSSSGAITSTSTGNTTLTSSGSTTLTSTGNTTVTSSGTVAITAASTATIQGAIQLNDENGNELLKTTTTASAVNEITLANSSTGNAPTLSATGGDTNIDMNFQAKGTGVFNHKGTSTSAAEIRLFEDTDNGTNYMGIKAPSAITANTSLVLPDGAGSASQFLQTNGSGTLSWVNPKLELISSATASSSATIDFTGLTSTYEGYIVVGNYIAPATDAANLYLRFSTDNGANYESGASAYRYVNHFTLDSGSDAVVTSTGAAQIQVAASIGNAAAEALNFVLWIFKPSSSTNDTAVKFNGTRISESAVFSAFYGAGWRALAQDTDAIRFLMSSGNIASGNFFLYGVRA